MVHHLKSNVIISYCLSILAMAWTEENTKTFTFQLARGDVKVSSYRGETIILECTQTLKSNKNGNNSPRGSKDIQWLVPPGIALYNNSSPSKTISDSRRRVGPWIELKSSRTLMFHNVDVSLQAAYVCYDGADNSTIWVKVLNRKSAETDDRIISGVVAVVVFMAICITGYLIHRWFERRKERRKYSTEKPMETNFTLIIPTIEIIDEEGEKVNQTVYDFM